MTGPMWLLAGTHAAAAAFGGTAMWVRCLTVCAHRHHVDDPAEAVPMSARSRRYPRMSAFRTRIGGRR